MMTNFKEMNIADFDLNIFQMIEKDWMLIGTSHDEKKDAMTASCGGFGVIYPYGPVAFILVRPQRGSLTVSKLKNPLQAL